MPEQRSDLFEIVMLLVDLHRDTVAKVVRLELGTADAFTVNLTQSPDVLAGHRARHQTAMPLTPRGPEQRRVGRERAVLLGDVLLEVLNSILATGATNGVPAQNLFLPATGLNSWSTGALRPAVPLFDEGISKRPLTDSALHERLAHGGWQRRAVSPLGRLR